MRETLVRTHQNIMMKLLILLMKFVADMDVNGIAASLNFGNSIGFDGTTFHKAPDKNSRIAAYASLQ